MKNATYLLVLITIPMVNLSQKEIMFSMIFWDIREMGNGKLFIAMEN